MLYKSTKEIDNNNSIKKTKINHNRSHAVVKNFIKKEVNMHRFRDFRGNLFLHN